MQQINLYQDEFRPRREVLSLRQAVAGLAGLLLVLLAVSAWQGWRSGQLAERVEATRQTLSRNETRLVSLREAQAARKPDPALAETVQRLARRVETKRRVLEVLAGKRFGNTEGFVPQLTGLARQRIEGLWLTELRLHGGGTRLDLAGNALKPELVPRYLQRLGNEQIFSGTAFETLRLTRPDKGPRWVSFVLHSQADKEDGS